MAMSLIYSAVLTACSECRTYQIMQAGRLTPLLAKAEAPSPTNPHRSGEALLLVASSTAPVISSDLPRIRAAARERNWRVLDLALMENELPRSVVPTLAVVAAVSDFDPLCNRLRRMGCRVVRMGTTPYPADPGVPIVVDHFEQEGRIAAEHFAERNFRAVGFPVWDEPSSRFEAFRDRATELGCTCHPLAFKPCSHRKNESQSQFLRRRYGLYLEALQEWAVSVPRPIGLACPTDGLAARYVHMITQLGFNVPNDVAILGRGDNPDICECAPVPLSSIRVNSKERVAIAFRLLDSMLAGDPVPTEPIEVPSDGITVRTSTDVQAALDPRMATGLRFIWSHYDVVDLSVDDIAAAAGLSRRRLHDLFRSEQGETIIAVLTKRRLERCRHLLTTTDITVTDICHHVGFRSSEHLHRVFKRTHGLTPLQYRAAHRGAPET